MPPKGKSSPSVGWFVNDRFFERAKESGNNSRGERWRLQLSHTCNSRSLPRGFNPDIGGGRRTQIGHSCHQLLSCYTVFLVLSAVVIRPWCQDTSRRRAPNATTTTPVGNTSSIKDEHRDVLKRVGVQEWPVTSSNGLRGCLDGASLSITGSTRTWKWALMLCPLQFPSEASFLNNKLSHSLHYNRTLEGKKVWLHRPQLHWYFPYKSKGKTGDLSAK